MNDLAALLREFPPVLCRLLAKENGTRLTAEQIAHRSGLSKDKVQRLSLRVDWHGRSMEHLIPFMRGCGVNPLKARRLRHLIRRGNYGHLKKLPRHEQEYYRKLFKILTNSRSYERGRVANDSRVSG